MMLAASLRSKLPALALQPTRTLGVSFATATTSGDPLKGDTRTSGPQQKAQETDEATKDSIRHAAEGNVSAAMGDIGNMAKGAAKGAASSAKLMADSLKKKATGAAKETAEDYDKDVGAKDTPAKNPGL